MAYKKIEGYSNDRFEVNSMGIIREIQTGRVLKVYLDSKGYNMVNLRKDKKQATVLVHKLVAKYFLAPVVGKIWINHKNSIRSDSRARNLERCTREENMRHASLKGRMARKITKKQAWEIRKLYERGKNQYVLGKQFGLSQGFISQIINRKAWKHI